MATWYCKNCKQTFEEGHPDGIGDAVEMCDKCKEKHCDEVVGRLNEIFEGDCMCPPPIDKRLSCPYQSEDGVGCGYCIAFYIKHGRVLEEKDLT